MHRYRVAQDSMLPNLAPGQEFVASTSLMAKRGDVVALPHPLQDDFWIVKRVAGLAGDDVSRIGGPENLDSEMAWVVSDNTIAAARDSSDFGPVPYESLRPMVTALDAVTFVEAVDLLAAEDEALAGAIQDHGPPPFWERQTGFATLVLLILEQQVSLESGAAVYRRLTQLVGDMTPSSVLSTDVDDLRRVGLTRQKAGYIRGLAIAIAGNEIDLDELANEPVDRAREVLTSVKGIGPWTAEAYLLSAERRPDIFPIGDRALQVGTGEVLGTETTPDPAELELLSEPWKPIRSAAARVIWHAYLSARGRSEPDHDFHPSRDSV